MKNSLEQLVSTAKCRGDTFVAIDQKEMKSSLMKQLHKRFRQHETHLGPSTKISRRSLMRLMLNHQLTVGIDGEVMCGMLFLKPQSEAGQKCRKHRNNMESVVNFRTAG